VTACQGAVTLRTMSTIRWGILSTGRIANTFAQGLEVLSDQRVAAVGSRSLASAERMASAYGARAHGSYEELASDTLLCLGAGKPVLCEKPLALNEAQGRQMIDRARERGVFLMEAMWTRFNPVTARVRQLIASGSIGEVRSITGDFGFRGEFDPSGRLFDPHLAGGSLLDVGVYCVAYASMIYGDEPEAIVALDDRGSTGIDEQCAWIQRHAGGRMANLSSAVRTDTAQQMVICGTKGMIVVPRFFYADRLVVNGVEEDIPLEGNAYHYQAIEVQRCLAESLLESPVISHDESLAILRTMDRIRAELGLRYPGE
jgi:predicted dehydrogenase